MENEEIAKKFLFIDLAIKNLELDLQHIINGLFKIKGPYVELINGMISKAINERRKLKQLMYRNKIQVVFLYTQGDFTTYTFVLGGIEKEVTFHNAVIKKSVESVIRKLVL